MECYYYILCMLKFCLNSIMHLNDIWSTNERKEMEVL